MKQNAVFLLLIGVALIGACSRQPSSSTEHQALSQSVNELLLPWHQHFAQQAKLLNDSAERFCQNPSNSGEFAATRDAWQSAMLAWQDLQIINFGPVAEDNQAWRIQFWPDRHNRVAQKVESLLSGETPLSSASLAEANVLVQGLSAMEYMLFDPSKGRLETYENPRACEYLIAVSANVEAIAQELYLAWQPQGGNFVATLLSPGESNVAFPTANDSLAAILSAIVSNLEILKNRKISEPFGGQPGNGHSNPFKVELWRSRLSLAAMKQQLSSDRKLFSSAIAPVLRDKNMGVLAKQIEQHLAQAEQQLQGIPGPLFDTLEDQEQLPRWQQVWQHLGQALSKLKADVPTVLQVQLGFNANDGD